MFKRDSDARITYSFNQEANVTYKGIQNVVNPTVAIGIAAGMIWKCLTVPTSKCSAASLSYCPGLLQALGAPSPPSVEFFENLPPAGGCPLVDNVLPGSSEIGPAPLPNAVQTRARDRLQEKLSRQEQSSVNDLTRT